MKKCKSCQKEIDDKAKKCPYCQSDQRGWFAKHPVITIILVLIVFGIIGSGKDKNNSNSDNTTETVQTVSSDTDKTEEAQPTEVTPEVINVTSLADDFDSNQVAAEAKWEGKLVEFTAKISNITDMGISFSDIASKDFSMVQIGCRIQNKDQLLPLKNGEMVTVRGVIGKQTIGVIDMLDCEVSE